MQCTSRSYTWCTARGALQLSSCFVAWGISGGSAQQGQPSHHNVAHHQTRPRFTPWLNPRQSCRRQAPKWPQKTQCCTHTTRITKLGTACMVPLPYTAQSLQCAAPKVVAIKRRDQTFIAPNKVFYLFGQRDAHILRLRWIECLVKCKPSQRPAPNADAQHLARQSA